MNEGMTVDLLWLVPLSLHTSFDVEAVSSPGARDGAVDVKFFSIRREVNEVGGSVGVTSHLS